MTSICPNQPHSQGEYCSKCHSDRRKNIDTGDGKETHELLHRLWTKAVGNDNYDKSEWKRLESSIFKYIPHTIDPLIKKVIEPEWKLEKGETHYMAAERRNQWLMKNGFPLPKNNHGITCVCLSRTSHTPFCLGERGD